jgi:4-hydroxybenzoate polyprenyltransferase
VQQGQTAAEMGQRHVLAYLHALRPHHWVKNILVFLPLLASHAVTPAALAQAALAFCAFCLVASGVYVVNDLLDLQADRAHPRKCQRPFAAGLLPVAQGPWLAGGLFAAGLGAALAVGATFAALMLFYVALATAYSLGLKRRVVLDICVLAGLYTLRIVAGGVATGTELSVWLLAFSAFLFLSLAAIKRQAELGEMALRGDKNAHGRGYRVSDLPVISMIVIASGYVAVLVLALYVNAPYVAALYSRPEALWGVCAVLWFWITRTALVAHRGQMPEDPVIFALRDLSGRVAALLAGGFVLWATLG